MKWFKHDSGAHTDTKLKKLRHKYGIQGYGLYWYCLELIAGKVDKNNITFELEDDAETIAIDWNMDQLKVQEIMEYMCELRLFDNQNGTISCLKLAKRLDDTNAKNPELRAILALLSPNESETVGEIPNKSDQTRLDKTRLDKNNKNTYAKPNGVRVPVQAVVDLYHSKLPTHPQVVKLTKTREGYIKQRWREDMDSLDAWSDYFDHVAKSSFLTGKEPPGQGRKAPFIADLEWLTKPGNIAKVVEGKYHG